jgi:hypothetical protein
MLTMRKLLVRCLLLGFAFLLVWQVSISCAADQSTGAAPYSWQKEVLATVGAVQGDTKVQRAGEAQFKKIAAKSPLYIMDFLATGKNSKLWWQGVFNAFTPSDKWKPGPDVTHGSLGADSVFGFKQFERAGASYRFVGYVQKGSVRFIKTLPNTNPPSTFTIGTQTAWIEVLPSDRATDFIVESKNEALTTVTVLWGKVRVRNVSPETKESRVLTSCQEVDVARDQEPSEIKWVSSDTMKELVKRTTIPKTLPEDIPSCERLKSEVILDQTEVYLAPPGVALYPAIVPVPVAIPGENPECCPPGKIYNRRTGQCVCPCPNGERPPPPPSATNGSTVNSIGPIGTGPCGSCRRGSNFNPDTCTCECPCPQGFLLPGQGCVSQCPEGYSQAWDSSNSPPYRCLYCVQYPPGTVVDPIPPPLRQCTPDSGRVPRDPDVPRVPDEVSRGVTPRPERPVLPDSPEVPPAGRGRASERIPTLIASVPSADCGPCDECVDGFCQPRLCRTGFYLDRISCECLPVKDGQPIACSDNTQCPSCMACVQGRCIPRIISCPEQQRLNSETCQCEPLNGKIPRSTQCRSDIVCKSDERLNVDTCKCEPIASKLCPGITCPAGQRLNVDTCKCEWDSLHRTPVAPHPGRPETPETLQSTGTRTPVERGTSSQCRKSIDCPIGQVCRKGKCVGEDEPSGPTGSEVTGSYTGPGRIRIGPQFGPGVGGIQPGSSGVQRQIVPKITPQMPVQRVPRRGKVN